MKNIVIRALAIASLLSAASVCSAAGATATNNMSVSATINPICFVNAGSSISFTAFDPSVTTAQTNSGTISVNCTNTTPFNIGLGVGNGTGASVANGRVMMSGSNSLTYQLYSDSGNSKVWGNTVNTDTVAGTGAGLTSDKAQTKTVYASIPLQPNAVPGSYADTVTITVTY